LLFFFIFNSKELHAKKWYVNDASVAGDIYCTAIGNNSNSGLTSNLPFLTLTKAVSVSADNDTIYLDAGTYNNESISLKKNNITLIGAGKTTTIFKATSIVTGPLFDNLGSYSTCSGNCNVIQLNLQKLKIQDYKNAGAIVVNASNNSDSTRVNITDCFFEGNYTASPNSVGGGAICIKTDITASSSKPAIVTLISCDFLNNNTNNTLSGGSIFVKINAD